MIRPEDIQALNASDKNADLDLLLDQSLIDPNASIDKPPTILSIRQQHGSEIIERRVFTLGNFSAIIGAAKAKKTYLLSLMVSALMRPDGLFNFVNGRIDGKPLILYFDTEQGEWDAQNVIRRICRLAGTTDNLRAYCLRPYTPPQRCDIINRAFELYGEQTCLCVVDGLADLVTAINDEEEATRAATMLLRLTHQYNCHMPIVIHKNKGDNNPGGWLGSMVQKKSEMVIRVMKDEQDNMASDVYCDLSRGSAGFEPFRITLDYDGNITMGDVLIRETNNYYESADAPF